MLKKKVKKCVSVSARKMFLSDKLKNRIPNETKVVNMIKLNFALKKSLHLSQLFLEVFS